MRFNVVCADGQKRHPEPFESFTAADEFARFRHCCFGGQHTIEPIKGFTFEEIIAAQFPGEPVLAPPSAGRLSQCLGCGCPLAAGHRFCSDACMDDVG